MERFFRYKLDHVFFWVLTLGFYAYTRQPMIGKVGIAMYVVDVLSRNGLLALLVYTNLLFVLPNALHRKKYGLSMIVLLSSVVFYVFLKNSVDGYTFPGRAWSENSFYNLSIAVFYLAFATTLQLSKEWYLQREQLRKIEVEKLNTELEYLKAQINPHFLFNSLNTIYFQIDKQNVSARETLSRFSEMLRYQLYECNGHTIAIEKEIRYLTNYVELQRLRANENYRINFQHPDALSSFSIPPLLLLPFIENAFKHVSHFTEKSNEVEITINTFENNFILKVTNTKDKISTAEAGGIGLKNVKRRLELLYGETYSLIINETDTQYAVNLSFPIEL